MERRKVSALKLRHLTVCSVLEGGGHVNCDTVFEGTRGFWRTFQRELETKKSIYPEGLK
jgi:hypothetical protein